MAGVGKTTDAKLSPLKRAYENAKSLVDDGPYAEANRRYHEGLTDVSDSLDMVGLERTTSVDEPIKGNLSVALQRRGQNTVTAGADTERLDIDAFKAKHPELANTVDAPEIIRKQGDLGFHVLPQRHGGLIDRTGSAIGGAALLEGLSHLASSGHVPGWGAVAAALLGLGVQNAKPLAGRVLYGPAQQAQIAAQMMLQGAPAIAAPGREVLPERR
jgi:hypothetical protein